MHSVGPDPTKEPICAVAATQQGGYDFGVQPGEDKAEAQGTLTEKIPYELLSDML